MRQQYDRMKQSNLRRSFRSRFDVDIVCESTKGKMCIFESSDADVILLCHPSMLYSIS